MWQVALLARGRIMRVMPAEEEMTVRQGIEGGWGRDRAPRGGVDEEGVNFPE